MNRAARNRRLMVWGFLIGIALAFWLGVALIFLSCAG